MSDITIFSIRIDSIKPTKVDASLSIIKHDQNQLNSIVKAELQKHGLTYDSVIYKIVDDVLYADGEAHAISEFNYAFV